MCRFRNGSHIKIDALFSNVVGRGSGTIENEIKFQWIPVKNRLKLCGDT